MKKFPIFLMGLLCLFIKSNAQTPGADECNSAIVLTPVSDTAGAGQGPYETLTATQSPQPSGDASGSDDDVWFQFTTLSTAKLYNIKLKDVSYDGGFGNPVIELWQQCTDGAFTSWYSYTTSALLGSLPPNTTYRIRVYTYSTSSRFSSFKIYVNYTAPAFNDECTNTVNIPVNTDGTYNLNVAGSTFGSSQSSSATMIPCSIPPDDDVWFKFVAPSTGRAQVNFTGNTETMFSVLYSGSSCGSLTNMQCNYNNDNVFSGLTPGAIYYLRVMTQNNGVHTGFNIGLRALNPTNTNTACATALALTTSPQVATTQGLTVDGSITACYGSNAPNKVLWYYFTATANTHFIDFSNIVKLSANQNALGYRLYSGDCSSLSSMICVSSVLSGNQTISGLSIGSIYYIQVMENTYNGGPVQFNIALATPDIPANDEYNTTPKVLIQNPTAVYTQTTMRFSTLSANPVAVPAGTYTQDVWFTFQAADVTTNVAITDGLQAAPRIALYNASGTTMISDGVSDAYTNSFSGLSVGTNYLLRVMNTATANINSTCDFKIAVYGAPSPEVATELPAGSNCITADGPVISTNSGRWLHITHQGKMLASIFDNAGTLGQINATYYISSGTVRSDASGIEYLNRNFEITPAITTIPAPPVRVRLYFSKTEFDALVAANDGDGNDLTWLNDLKVAKFSAQPCSATINISGEVLYDVVNWGLLNTNVYYVECLIPSFSSFFMKTLPASTPLAIECTDFTYQEKGADINLHWNLYDGKALHYVEVQRSEDGIHFETIGKVSVSEQTSYDYIDNPISNTNVFYRLKAVFSNGSEKYICDVLQIHPSDKDQVSFDAYPNPVSKTLKIDLPKSYAGDVKIEFINAMGTTVLLKNFNKDGHRTQMTLDVSSLSTGIYILKVTTNDVVFSKRISKK